jgi:hypothetical protein
MLYQNRLTCFKNEKEREKRKSLFIFNPKFTHLLLMMMTRTTTSLDDDDEPEKKNNYKIYIFYETHTHTQIN